MRHGCLLVAEITWLIVFVKLSPSLFLQLPRTPLTSLAHRPPAHGNDLSHMCNTRERFSSLDGENGRDDVPSLEVAGVGGNVGTMPKSGVN